jgi:uncharacterized RDD family membrane protein YckC
LHADEPLRIETPEQVALELPVAGIGSRFLAVAVDTVLQLVLCVTAVIGMIVVAPRLGARVADVPALAAQVGPAAIILFVFCVYWGYFAFFETIWSGRTPGKRLAHIRVVKESGRGINVYEAITRNILRAIDFLPMWYGVGVVVMMFNRNSRRIGDYVAGTLVVHDRLAIGLRPTRSPAVPHAGAGEAFARMTTEELVLIETYLQRRTELEPSVRDQMAEQITDRILRKTGLSREPGRPIDDFLESAARGIRDNARFRR